MELVRELIGNPEFNHPDIIRYAPERLYTQTKPGGSYEREYGEAWTGDWWGNVQVSNIDLM